MPYVRDLMERRQGSGTLGERLRAVNAAAVSLRSSGCSADELHEEFIRWVREQRRREAIEYERIRKMVLL